MADLGPSKSLRSQWTLSASRDPSFVYLAELPRGKGDYSRTGVCANAFRVDVRYCVDNRALILKSPGFHLKPALHSVRVVLFVDRESNGKFPPDIMEETAAEVRHRLLQDNRFDVLMDRLHTAVPESCRRYHFQTMVDFPLVYSGVTGKPSELATNAIGVMVTTGYPLAGSVVHGSGQVWFSDLAMEIPDEASASCLGLY